jgi:hypothetical protein
MEVSEPKNFGTLAIEDYSAVENLLANRGLRARILTPDNVFKQNWKLISYLDKLARDVIEIFRNEHRIQKTIHHCFLGIITANAMAARLATTPEKYCIIFNIGILDIREIIMKCLRLGSVREILGLDYINSSRQNEIFYRQVDLLTQMALTFLVFHELAHIKNGHLHLPRTLRLGAVSEENSKSNLNLDYNLTVHTLEMDADCVACGHTLPLFINQCEELFSSFKVKPAKAAVLAFSTVVYLMFRMFDRPDWDVLGMMHYTHPPAFVRHSNIMGWIVTWFDELPNQDMSIDGAIELVKEIELELFRPAGFIMSPDIIQFFEDGHMLYKRQLDRRWRELRPMLEQHLLGGILAPA